MTSGFQDRSLAVRVTQWIVTAVLVGHALWVILAHDWSVVAGLFVALAVVYERRTTETLRRLRFQWQHPAP